MKALTALSLAFLLAACGGGGGSSTPAAPAAPQPPKPVLIDAQGDSTMCGYNGLVCDLVAAPPAVLQGLLQAKMGPDVHVTNNGRPGATLSYDLYGFAGYYTTPIATRLATSGAQIVIENFALNDAVHSIPSQYRIDLGLWVDTVRAMGKTPVLEEPNPATFESPVLDSLVAIIDDVAKEKNVALVQQYQYIKSLPNYASLYVDGIHPGAQLYAIKAQREADVLLPIVEGLQK